jgi:hypothetical protein
MFTRALRWSLSRAILIQSLPAHPISPRSSLTSLSHLRGLFHSGFPTKTTCMHSSPMRTTCSAHRIFLDLIILIILDEEEKVMNLLIWRISGPKNKRM